MIDYPDDPFSNSIRKRLLWSELMRLTRELSVKTLINTDEFLEEVLHARLKELSQCESEHGYVYFGEKHWLTAVADGLGCSYKQWIAEFLLQQKRLCWEDPKISLYDDPKSSSPPTEVDQQWNQPFGGMINTKLLPPLFREQAQQFSNYNEGMKFSVGPRPEDGLIDDATLLVQVFHILHIFPYYAEKVIEYLLWRGEKLDNLDPELWGKVWLLKPGRANSSLWVTSLGQWEFPFLKHDVCVAMIHNYDKPEIHGQYADRADEVSSHRAKKNLPFWM